MYRNLAIVAVMLLTLTACNKDKAKQAEHTATEAATTVAHAIAVQPTTPTEAQPAAVQADEAITHPAENLIVNETQNLEAAPAAPEAGVEVAQECNNYTTSIVSVKLENNFGPVFVPHSLHVELYDCSTCHGDGVPGKIEKTKKQFHATCRGCHAKIEAGPTKCGACHQRTK